MAEELKDSGTVTAMSVVGFVFGLIGMLGSFIPCLGSLAFYVGIPAAIISGIALGVAYSQNAKRTFAIVAVTISLIGVVISGWQYFSIISAGNKAKRALEEMTRSPMTTAPTRTAQEAPSTSSQTPRPAQSGPQVVVIQSAAGKDNAEEARRLFNEAYEKLFQERNYTKNMALRNNSDWRTTESTLLKGVENLVKVEGPTYAIFVLLFNKKVKIDNKCDGNFEPLVGVPAETGLAQPSYRTDGSISNEICCKQYLFEAYYEDEKLELLFPAAFQKDYKVSLRDATLVK